MSYALATANGETLAVFRDRSSEAEWTEKAMLWLREAADCGHPSAAAWVDERLPVTMRELSHGDLIELLREGTPLLQREP